MEKNKKNEEDKERDECILELNRSFAFLAIQENMLCFMPDVESIIFNDRYGDTAYCSAYRWSLIISHRGFCQALTAS